MKSLRVSFLFKPVGLDEYVLLQSKDLFDSEDNAKEEFSISTELQTEEVEAVVASDLKREDVDFFSSSSVSWGDSFSVSYKSSKINIPLHPSGRESFISELKTIRCKLMKKIKNAAFFMKIYFLYYIL